jgi:hypothetical protein
MRLSIERLWLELVRRTGVPEFIKRCIKFIVAEGIDSLPHPSAC